MQIALLILLWH